VGKQLNEFAYCGPRTHLFLDAATNAVIPWITYESDGMGGGSIKIEPVISSASELKSYTINWTTKLENY